MDSTPNAFRLVAGPECALAVWPAHKAIPPQWTETGITGNREACLDAVATVTLDATGPRDGPNHDEPGPETLVSLFAAAARRYPQCTAVSDDETALSYAELDLRSTALAHRLMRHGIRPGDRVAVYGPRSADTIVALLGISKAGAAYVAVDARYPDARRDALIRGSGVRLLLVAPQWADRFVPPLIEILPWSGDEASERDTPRGEWPVGPRTAACILFTSGSTGVPKGVVLEHAGLAAFAVNPRLPRLRPDDRMGQVSSPSFDAFHFEVWCSLAQGAHVVVLPAMVELVAGDLLRELRRRRITAMLVPSMAINHVIRDDRDAFACLRILCTGGDVVSPEACRDLLASEFRGRFFNLYGPTEATTACTIHEVTALAPDATDVPIGTPLAGADVYLLDDDLEPVPPGTIGEVFIGGVGVARGYLGDPRLTAERFLPDPLRPGGGRMYRTGDLARARLEGPLEFVGRADRQAKIRGYRVEPAEVERVLLGHPEVREVCVYVAGEGGERQLVAFVEPHDMVTPRSLREYAGERMPDYLRPTLFIVLPEIPATENGKRDWARLSAILEEHRQRHAAYIEPAGEVEKYLANLWADLLATERVGATDDFFALGGHSLLAFRAQRRIRRELGVDLEIEDLLNHTLLRELADLMSTNYPSPRAVRS